MDPTSSTSGSQDTEPAFKTYKELLRYHASEDRSCEALLYMYGKESEVKAQDSIARFDSILRVWDSNGSCLKRVDVDPKEVANYSVSTKVRIIIYTYTRCDPNFMVALDPVALALRLSPEILWLHFKDMYIGQELDRYPKGLMHIRPTFETCKVLDFEDNLTFCPYTCILFPREDDQGTAIWLFLIQDTERTLDVWLPHFQILNGSPFSFARFGGQTILEFLASSFEGMNQDSCTAANEHPCLYLKGLIQYFSSLILRELERPAYSVDLHRLYMDNVSLGSIRETVRLVTNCTAVAESLLEQIRDHASESDRTSGALQELTTELERAARIARRRQTEMSDFLALIVSLASLEETRNSIKQAGGTKRISQLAYIYLPLAFGTSLFGMNVRQFEDASLVTYVGTTLILLFLSMLFWYAFGPSQGVWKHIRESFADKEVVSFIRLLFRVHPLCAFAFTVYLICYGSGETRSLFAAMDLRDLVLLSPIESLRKQDVVIPSIEVVDANLKDAGGTQRPWWRPLRRYIHWRLRDRSRNPGSDESEA